MAHERTPATADVEKGLSFLEVDLLAQHVELVDLRLLERLVEALVEGRRVDHLRPEEGVEEVVAAVIVVGDLVRRCRDRLE